MKQQKNRFICLLVFLVSVVLFSTSGHAQDIAVNGDSPRFSISNDTIISAINKLGHQVSARKNSDGVPHFLIDENVENVRDIAVFTADCGKAGCTDVILYADFGEVDKLTAKHINGWNHISNLKRSKAFRSDSIDSDGHVGLTMTVSFLDNTEEDKFAMQTGLFLTEVGMFSALIDQVSQLSSSTLR